MPSHVILATATACAGLALSTATLAYQPLITDDTGTQGEGGNQVELSYARNTERAEGSKTVTGTVPVGYTRGLADALDLYAGVSHVRIKTDAVATGSGGGNPVLGAKWRFREEEKGWSLALKPEIQFGVSAGAEAKGLGMGRTGWSAMLIATRETDFGEFHVNVAYARARFETEDEISGNRKDLWRLSAAPVWGINDQWKVALDLGLQTNSDKTLNSRMAYALLGAVYSPSKDFDLALGWQKPFEDGPARVWQATVGGTWRFR